jgi:hypothetical protein
MGDKFSYGRSAMRSTRWAAVVASVLVLLAVGCRGSVPVYNVTDAPVSASKPNPSLDDVGKAIQRAGATLGWQMKETKPGHMLGTLNLRKHVAVVDVNYSVKSYSIKYKDSTELDYNDGNIHPNYNGWIQILDKGIRAQLSTL